MSEGEDEVRENIKRMINELDDVSNFFFPNHKSKNKDAAEHAQYIELHKKKAEKLKQLPTLEGRRAIEKELKAEKKAKAELNKLRIYGKLPIKDKELDSAVKTCRKLSKELQAAKQKYADADWQHRYWHITKKSDELEHAKTALRKLRTSKMKGIKNFEYDFFGDVALLYFPEIPDKDHKKAVQLCHEIATIKQNIQAIVSISSETDLANMPRIQELENDIELRTARYLPPDYNIWDTYVMSATVNKTLKEKYFWIMRHLPAYGCFVYKPKLAKFSHDPKFAEYSIENFESILDALKVEHEEAKPAALKFRYWDFYSDNVALALETEKTFKFAVKFFWDDDFTNVGVEKKVCKMYLNQDNKETNQQERQKAMHEINKLAKRMAKYAAETYTTLKDTAEDVAYAAKQDKIPEDGSVAWAVTDVLTRLLERIRRNAYNSHEPTFTTTAGEERKIVFQTEESGLERHYFSIVDLKTEEEVVNSKEADVFFMALDDMGQSYDLPYRFSDDDEVGLRKFRGYTMFTIPQYKQYKPFMAQIRKMIEPQLPTRQQLKITGTNAASPPRQSYIDHGVQKADELDTSWTARLLRKFAQVTTGKWHTGGLVQINIIKDKSKCNGTIANVDTHYNKIDVNLSLQDVVKYPALFRLATSLPSDDARRVHFKLSTGNKYVPFDTTKSEGKKQKYQAACNTIFQYSNLVTM